MGFSRAAVTSWNIQLLQCVEFFMGCRTDIYSSVVSSMTCREINCSTRGYRGISEHLLTLLVWLSLSQDYFSHSSHSSPSSFPCLSFLPFLKYVVLKEWRTQLTPSALFCGGSTVGWAETGCVSDKTTSDLPQKPALQPQHCPKACHLHPEQVKFQRHI